jgi:cysteine synthase A
VETGMKWLSLTNAEVVDVSLREALEGVREFAKRTGLLIGPSAGAVYKAFTAQRRDGVYVLMFPDSLMKYTLLLEQLR